MFHVWGGGREGEKNEGEVGIGENIGGVEENVCRKKLDWERGIEEVEKGEKGGMARSKL